MKEDEEFSDSDFIDDYMQTVDLQELARRFPDSIRLGSLRADAAYKAMVSDYIRHTDASREEKDFAFKQKEHAKRMYQMAIDFIKEPYEVEQEQFPEGQDYYYDPDTEGNSFEHNIQIINDKIIEENKTPEPPPFKPYIE